MDDPPAGLDGWKRVWQEDLQFRVDQDSSLLDRLLIRLLGPTIRRVQAPIDGRQRDFNIAVLDMLEDLRKDLASIAADSMRDATDLRRDVSQIEGRLPIAVRRNDALVAAIDQKIEAVSARLGDLSIPLLLKPDASGFRSDFVYRRLEDGLRGSPDEIRQSLEPYLTYASEMPPVIDVGCGRGEFLELCREHGVPARGFDTNERSVAELRHREFDAEIGALPECLLTLQAESAGSILMAHVVEHLPSDVLVETVSAAARTLRTGGYLMIETPNAGSVTMSASQFWRDPTHLAPRHVGALTLIGREFGFEVAEVRTVAPFPEANRISVSDTSGELRDVVARLNEILFGDQNLRLVLRKVASNA